MRYCLTLHSLERARPSPGKILHRKLIRQRQASSNNIAAYSAWQGVGKVRLAVIWLVCNTPM